MDATTVGMVTRTSIGWATARVLVFCCLIALTLGPVAWTVMSSVKSNGAIMLNPWSFPTSLEFSNYADAWNTGGIGRSLINSIVVAALSLLMMIGSGAMAAFAISKYTKVRVRWPLLVLFLLGQMIPAQVVIIPIYEEIFRLGLLNTYIGLALVYTASGLPFVVFILQAFFQTIPRELYDAASVDGYGELRVFWKVAVPLAMPAIVTTVILQFLYVWNEFILASALDGSGCCVTLPVGLYSAVQGPYSTSYGVAFAGVCLVIIPIIAVYAVLQRAIIKGIAFGAVKG